MGGGATCNPHPQSRLIQSGSMVRASVLILTALALHAAAIDQKDVEYGKPGGKALLLDLHVPDGAGPFPAAILVHGGGFDQGSKSTNPRPLFEPLANAGFAWFSIDYRMAPEFRFPQAKEDIDAAIRWVKAHAATPQTVYHYYERWLDSLERLVTERGLLTEQEIQHRVNHLHESDHH